MRDLKSSVLVPLKRIKSPYYIRMSTKEVTLTIGERLATAKILNAFKGDITQLALFLDDIKKIAMTEEEWTNAKLTKTPINDAEGNPTGKEQWNWEDTEAQEKVITLDGETILYVLNQIKTKNDNKEITIEDVPLITLQKKLA